MVSVYLSKFGAEATVYNMKKIINLFLVLFAGLILVSLGTPEVFAEENDFEFNITVEKGETIVKLHPLSGDFGTRISFDAKGLEVDEFEFAYHILNGEVIEASSYDVLASKSTNLIVVLEEQGEPVTTYIDTNGELLGASYHLKTNQLQNLQNLDLNFKIMYKLKILRSLFL